MSDLPFKVKAVYSYESPHEDDLNFSSGQIITVTEEEDNDWYYGEYVDESGLTKEGIFPRNFVERLQPDAPPRPTRPHRARKGAGAGASTIRELSKPDRGQDGQSPLDESSQQPGGSVADGQISHPAPIHTEHGLASSPSQTQPPSKANTDSQSKAESSPLPTQAASVQSKAVPPSPADKSVASSFKDRIAAFNKPAAPPITPFKPAGLGQGGSSFIKKPYVPPPPSRDAYIPPPRETPQKTYRREEAVEAEAVEAEAPTSPELRTTEIFTQAQDVESQQKPTSLKERIALLQKQQLENAARRSEAAQKRETGKRPPKQRMGSFEDGETNESGPGFSNVETPRGVEIADDLSTIDTHSQNLTGPAAEPTVSHPTSTVSAHDIPSDANDADQSGLDEIAEDVEGNSTKQDDNDRAAIAIIPNRSVVRPAPAPPDVEGCRDKTRGESGDDGQEDEGEEVDIDPEIRRRMEIRERMAKMSGGMGMHGMFGMAGGLARTPFGGATKKEKSGGTSGEKMSLVGRHTEREDRGSVPRGQSIPVLPPLPRSQSFGVTERTSTSPIENDPLPASEINRETLVHEGPAQDEETEVEGGLPPHTEPSKQPAPKTPDRTGRHALMYLLFTDILKDRDRLPSQATPMTGRTIYIYRLHFLVSIITESLISLLT